MQRSYAPASHHPVTRAVRPLVMLLTLLSGCFGANEAVAQLSIDVTPVRFELSGSPGGTFSDAITVANTGADAVRLRVLVEDWELTPEGQPLFLPVGMARYSAAPWLQAGPRDILLEPGASQAVRFEVRVPPGVESATHHAALVLESVPLHDAARPLRQLFVHGRIACMVYITVGTPERELVLRSLEPIRKQGRTLLALELENPSRAMVRLDGRIELLRAGVDPRFVALLPGVPVLPGGWRRIEVDVTDAAWRDGDVARAQIRVDPRGDLVGELEMGAMADGLVDRVAPARE